MKNEIFVYRVLSFVVPCYNEKQMIPVFYQEVIQVISTLQNLTFEFYFVDDGSTDESLIVLQSLAKKDKRVHYISFSRNFGKEAAILAGLEKAKGDYVVLMDVDLQDPPSLIPKMLEAVILDGYDVARVKRTTREGEPKIRSFFARLFYKIINKISDVKIIEGVRDFSLMTKEYVNAVLLLKEKNRFSKEIFPWVGFKAKYFEYTNIKRPFGESKWNVLSLLLYALDGIASCSVVPLVIVPFFMMIIFLISSFVVFYKYICGNQVDGCTLIICVMLFSNNVVFFVLGQYISKIYIEVKQRPIYVIKQEL